MMISSIVGSGIFISAGALARDVGDPRLIIICWILGGLMAVAGAVSYAYPAVIFPKAGGDYIYLKEAYSPLVAFMSGWAALLANLSANVTVIALAFSSNFFDIFPDLKFELFHINLKFMEISFGSAQIIGILMIGFFTWVNIRGVERAVRLQNFFTALKVGGLSLFVIAGFLFGKLDGGNFKAVANLPLPDNSISLILLGIVPVSFTYLGWNLVTYFAGEVKEPEKNIPKSIYAALGFVIILYTSINLLYLYSADMKVIAASEQVGLTSAEALFGKGLKIVFSVFVLWVLVGSVSAMMFGAPRLFYAMAKDGVFYESLSELHPKYGTPWKAVLFLGVYSSLLLFVNSIYMLLYMITCAVLALSIITALTPFYLMKKGMISDYKIPLFPFTPILFAAGNAVVIFNLAVNFPTNAMWGIGITLTGIPAYYLFNRKW